jgi:hypothetical protein
MEGNIFPKKMSNIKVSYQSVSSRLFCSSFHVLISVFWPSCLTSSFQADLSRQNCQANLPSMTCPSYPVPLSCPFCPPLAVLPWLSYPGCPVSDILSFLSQSNHLSRLTSPGCCQADLFRLTCPGCNCGWPTTVVLYR